MNRLAAAKAYLEERLGERSTWMLFGAAVSAAAALAWPWSLIFCVLGIIGALVPDKKGSGDAS